MLSLHNVTASQSANYFRLDNYYSTKEGIENSSWFGSGADIFGLHGKVTAAEFNHLLNGLSPDGAESLRGKGDNDEGKLTLEKSKKLSKKLNKS